MPFPFSAGEILTATNLNNVVPRAGSDSTIDSAGPSSGTTRLAYQSISIPDYGVGKLHVHAMALGAKTVGTDVFDIDVSIGATQWRARNVTNSTAGMQYMVFGSFDVTGAETLTAGVTRTTGTGTITLTAGGFTLVSWTFVPQ